MLTLYPWSELALSAYRVPGSWSNSRFIITNYSKNIIFHHNSKVMCYTCTLLIGLSLLLCFADERRSYYPENNLISMYPADAVWNKMDIQKTSLTICYVHVL